MATAYDLSDIQRRYYEKIAAGGCTYRFDPMPVSKDRCIPVTHPFTSRPAGRRRATVAAMLYRSDDAPTDVLEALIATGAVLASPLDIDHGNLIALPLEDDEDNTDA